MDFYFRKDRNRYRNECKECWKELKKKYRRKNKEKIKKQQKEYGKKYRFMNREKESKRQQEYYKKNKKKVIKRTTKYHKNQYQVNPKIRLNQSISVLIRRSLKGNKQRRHWESYVDFTQEELALHLEKQFLVGMTWANYGEWHIDHIVPISAFNYDSPDHIDFKRCWALSNLRPMWATENLKKWSKIDEPFQPSLKI